MESSFPGDELVLNPFIERTSEIIINAPEFAVWPWLIQMGYHRGGWYIDKWWDKFEQKHIWPKLVPKEARGNYLPPADKILSEYQNLKVGDIIPDGPPGSAYYQVVELEENHLLLLLATSHFKYMAPRFVYKTRWAPRGKWSWAFIITPLSSDQCKLVSRWRGEAEPRWLFKIYKPFVELIDKSHNAAILQGIKRRVEQSVHQ